MVRLKGITVELITKTYTEDNEIGIPIYKEKSIEVENVLVSPTKSEDVLNTQNLTGRTATYTLAIPKNDTNDWEDKEVIFFGKKWRTFGIPIKGIDELIPLDWNTKVMVERYE